MTRNQQNRQIVTPKEKMSAGEVGATVPLESFDNALDTVISLRARVEQLEKALKPTAWSIKAPEWGWPPFHIQDWRAFPTRREAIEHAGKVCNPRDWRKGWRKAYILGFRAVRVVVLEASK